ncbi:MAG: ATP synthase F0 subunit B [Candidatus Alcyoniella australis]|nr:ATP synthase F0 subunit B [Candidatus Alcyoniella australis]
MLSLNATFLYQAVLFITLLILMNKLLFKPMLELISRREQAQDEPLEQAQKYKTVAEEFESQVRGKLLEIKQQADKLQTELTREASGQALARMSQARTEAEQIMEQARLKIQQAEQQARSALDAQAGSLADRIVAQILG